MTQRPASENGATDNASTPTKELADLRKRLSRRETLNLVSVVAGATVALVALGLSWKTAFDGSKAGVSAERLTERAVVAAETSANAAQQAVRDNREAIGSQLKLSSDALAETRAQSEIVRIATRLDQRPWIGVATFEGDLPTRGEALEVTVEFRNGGKTPATNLTGTINMVQCPPDFHLPAKLRSNRALLPMDPGASASHAFVLPGTGFSLSRTLSSTSVDEYLRAERKLTIYAWGRVTYDDVFMRHHWLTFCIMTNSATAGYVKCEQGNESDEEALPGLTTHTK